MQCHNRVECQQYDFHLFALCIDIVDPISIGVSLHSPKHFQSLRYSSFGVVGPRLFNVLPVNIRNISGCTVETFKLHLDRFLATVPDEPQVRGYTAMRRAEPNSLLHMAQLAGPQRV